MKKFLVLIIYALIATAVFILPGSCKHEYIVNCNDHILKLTLTKTDATINNSDGIIAASATGGTGFKYSLNGGPFQSDSVFTGLTPFKNYHVVVMSSAGCTDTANIDVNTSDPCKGTPPSLTITKTNTSSGKSDGEISVSASGGSGFQFSLNSGAFQSSGDFTGLAAGNYNVTAKNADGCTVSTTVTIDAMVDPCAGVNIVVSLSKTDPTSGANGSITATASGAAGLTYSLNGGAYQSSGNFGNLAAGTYTVTAQSAAGCSGSASITLSQGGACSGITITVSLTKTDPASGSNGSITASASGGSGFTYSINGGAYQSGNIFSNLAAGTYTVSAKSSGGCTGSASITLSQANSCSSVNISVTYTAVAAVPCSTSGNSGSLTVSASGSTGFTYNINGGAYQASGTFSNLAAGNYTIGVKDGNGCTTTSTATVATMQAGTQYSAVKSLILSKCSGCHTNG